MKKIFFTIQFTFCLQFLNAQSVYPLVVDLTVDSILHVQPGASKMSFDRISGHLFYCSSDGNIYEVFIPGAGSASDSLRFTVADHGISSLQGLFFHDSSLFICGNVWSATTTVRKIMKGQLQPNGSRIWSPVVTTDPYPSSSSTGDHGFTGVCVDPQENYIYVSSGARTHLGEVRTNNGAWPELREVPITCHIFRFPLNSSGIVLQNDSAFLSSSGYIFADGTRNAYDIAWDWNDTLFAVDNSGERDDPEELNWLRQGKHYGYPWRMGGDDNPLRVSPYDVEQDPLVNHLSMGYINGWFADDPTFPPVPNGIAFTDPVRNYGSAADFYRDSVTGMVKKAFDEGTFITSFTAHRSPLGLVFDRDGMLDNPYRGDGFVLSFMPGGDSTGYTPLSPWGTPCPFVDPSRELVQLKLNYDSNIDNYLMTTTNLVTGFYKPVDAELINNSLYVIENNGNLWKVTFPLFPGIEEHNRTFSISLSPNPFRTSTQIRINGPFVNEKQIQLYNIVGQTVLTIPHIIGSEITIEKGSLSSGVYILQLQSENEILAVEKLIVE